tara:strand:- start:665 stop:1183 length:519 start_codon:yes stop_codon:yes gene_type:complete
MLSVRAARVVFLVAAAWFYFGPPASPYGNGHTLAQATNRAHRSSRTKPTSAIPRRLMFVAVNGFLTKGDLYAASASGLHPAAALNVQRMVRMHRNVSHKMYTNDDCLEVLQEQKRHTMWKQPPRGNSPSSTPRQRQIKMRAASSLGQPRPIGRRVLKTRPVTPTLFSIGATR